MNIKSVCVIGAGPSGLCAIKELKEAGHNISCFEKASEVGGVFALTQNAAAYDSLSLTVSNYFMAYSGYPLPSGTERRYWSTKEYYEYLVRYAKHFDLYNNIKFNHTVNDIQHIDGKYHVNYSDSEHNHHTEVFDVLVVCTGTNRVPNIPDIPGLDSFTGQVIHTENYTNGKPFTGRKVMCVGAGESGADVVHEISQVAEKCTLAMRSAPSIVPKWIGRHTNDAYTSRSFNAMGKNGMNRFMSLKSKWKLKFDKNLDAGQRLHHQWVAKHAGYFNRFLTKNDIFLDDIASGRLELIEQHIKCIDGDKVELADGTIRQVDTLMFNTGYKEDFNIIHSFLKIDNFRDLFKHAFHPDFGNSLAFVGWARPAQGGVPACAEMQARYLALSLNGQVKFPEPALIREMIAKDKQWEENFFDGSCHLSSLVDYHQFMNSLAKLIGCQPDLEVMLNPQNAYKIWFGCHLASIYRISGPGAMKEKSLSVINELPVASSIGRNLTVTLMALVYRVGSLLQRPSGA